MRNEENSMIFDLVFQTQLPILFLILITWLLIFKDRAFFSRLRIDFYMLLVLSIAVMITNNLGDYVQLNPRDEFLIYGLGRMVIRPFILMIWLGIVLRKQNNRSLSFMLIPIPVILNLLVCISSVWNELVFAITPDGAWEWGRLFFIPQIIYLLYLILIVVFSIRNARKEDTLEHLIIMLIAAGILVSTNVEMQFGVTNLTDNVVAVGVCVYYFCLITQVYKLDALTHVMNRHNLLYDLEELEAKEYLITMIDIDNFKSINDKYGHEKGDEALKRVVRVIKNNLTKKNKIYRYGGDEFAVVSQGMTEEDLNNIFENVNIELKTYDYRISYGIYRHVPGQKMLDAINAADVLMYENKRMLKSENIWDDMTGLFNLRGFLDELDTMRKHAAREQKDICLIGFDIEHLDNVNMAYGYAEGNMIITLLGNILKKQLHPSQFVGHLGSDEFVVAMKIAKGETEEPEEFILRVLSDVRNAEELSGKKYTIEINSATLVIHPVECTSVEKAVNDVLYQKQADKESRRKSYSLHNGDSQRVDPEEEATALDIIDNNRFKYAMQPIVSAKDGSIVAYEALMRTDTEPMLPPLTILRHAKNHDKYYLIEKYTFRNVLELFREKKETLQNRKVFLNSIPGFILSEQDYQDIRMEYGDLLEQVVVEINEQSVLEDDELAMIKKRQVDDHFGVAIDDYGSGNANTYSLLRIKPQIIKLDRLLINDIDRNTKKQYFVNSIITFAKENNMEVLAEGVETEAELRMVIRLKVDYIQGYYTAKPSMDLMADIDGEVKKVIVSENIRSDAENKRKIYTASSPAELSLVQLALEEYNGITVTTSGLSILGNTDYVADMCIKVMEGVTCEIDLHDVRLNAVDDLPCIDIGEGADVTLRINGNCTIDQKGIHVPEGAKVKIVGSGNLTLDTKGHDCYGIGCGHNESMGSICLMLSGKMTVRVDGEESIAIGGGTYHSGEGIYICGGGYDINVASMDGIGIGCFYGDVPLDFRMCYIMMELRVNEGTGIGSRQGKQSVHMEHFTVLVKGSGSKLSGVGTNYPSGGKLTFAEGTFEANMNGQDVILMGTLAGQTQVVMKSCKAKLHGEGNEVLAMGALDGNGTVSLVEVSTNITINSAKPVAFGTPEGVFESVGPYPTIHINE